MYILVNQKTINYQICSKRMKDNLHNRLAGNMIKPPIKSFWTLNYVFAKRFFALVSYICDVV